jgi:ADP-ribose pyrophosphatase YjhB (NUDIX family)
LDERSYPDRPYLAVSAAIIRNGEVLVVRRARPPAQDLFSLPGGIVEKGETLSDAIVREVREETGIAIEPVRLAGHREVIRRDKDGRIAHHFVILAFAARWLEGEFRPSDEIAEARWLRPAETRALATTEGLAEIIASAFDILEQHG